MVKQKNNPNQIPITEFILTFLSYTLAGTVSTLMSVYLPFVIADLLNKEKPNADIGQFGAILNATFIFGWMAGGLVIGYLSDRRGRIGALAISTFMYGSLTLAMCLVNDINLFLILRFFSGFGVGGVLVISTVYISEICSIKYKPIALGLLASGFPIGIVLTGVLNMMFKEWRDAFLCGFLPMAIAILILGFAKESSSWKTNLKNLNSLLWKEYFKINGKNLWVGSSIFGCVLIGLWGIFSWMPTWIQSIAVDEPSGQQARSLNMMIFGCGGILGSFLSGYLIRKLGILYTLTFTFGGCLLMSFILFLTNTEISPTLLMETAILSILFGISQGSLSTYIPSLFDTHIRATASGFCFNISRFVTGIAVFFVGNLAMYFGGLGNSLLVFSTPFGIALLITVFSYERQNQINNKLQLKSNLS
jgi:predicted MFS family arabinose efflux permease